MSEPNTSTEKSVYIILSEQIEKSKLQGTMKVVLNSMVRLLALSYNSDVKLLDLIEKGSDSTREIVKGMTELIEELVKSVDMLLKSTDRPKDVEQMKSNVEKLSGFIPMLESLEERIQNNQRKNEARKGKCGKANKGFGYLWLIS